MAETPDDILRALADPERLAIAGMLARARRSSSRARRGAGHAGRPGPQAPQPAHRDRASSAWSPTGGPTGWTRRPCDGRPSRSARRASAGLALGAANEDEEAVLRTFFRDGRLTEIPAKEAKRRIVLERIAIEFEPGMRYDEKEVNAIVGRFFNDYAALRRYLVDGGFLDREHGVYWRTGGRVDV